MTVFEKPQKRDGGHIEKVEKTMVTTSAMMKISIEKVRPQLPSTANLV